MNNSNRIGMATAIGAGVGGAFYSATGEAAWIGIGAVLGALFSMLKKINKPKKAKIRIKMNK